METTFEWISENMAWLSWLGGLSIVMVILSAIIVPILVVRMRSDYFLSSTDQEDRVEPSRKPLTHLLAKAVKNITGGILVFGGILMCILPGQGLLTILIGLAFMDFPGKRRLEIWLFRRKPINWAINKMREKANRKPLLLPDF